MYFVNSDVDFPNSFLGGIRNEPYEALTAIATLGQKIRSNLKFAVGNQFISLWACIGTPRNEIDNPINYCTQPFDIQVAAFAISNITVSLSKEYKFLPQGEFTLSNSWRSSIHFEEKLIERIQEHNNPKNIWKWFPHGRIPVAEYYAVAYVTGSITAEKALELSGTDYVNFAQMVQKEATERDLPIFRAFLEDEKVESSLPFSKEKALEFKDQLAEEIE
jgi:hypothetical protein